MEQPDDVTQAPPRDREEALAELAALLPHCHEETLLTLVAIVRIITGRHAG